MRGRPRAAAAAAAPSVSEGGASYPQKAGLGRTPAAGDAQQARRLLGEVAALLRLSMPDSRPIRTTRLFPRRKCK